MEINSVRSYLAVFAMAALVAHNLLFVVFQSDIEGGSTMGSVSEGTGKMLHTCVGSVRVQVRCCTPVWGECLMVQ